MFVKWNWYAPLKALVKAKQRKFFNRIWLERCELDNDPLIHVMNIVFRYNDCVSRDIRDMTINNVNDVSIATNNLKTKTFSSVAKIG